MRLSTAGLIRGWFSPAGLVASRSHLRHSTTPIPFQGLLKRKESSSSIIPLDAKAKRSCMSHRKAPCPLKTCPPMGTTTNHEQFFELLLQFQHLFPFYFNFSHLILHCFSKPLRLYIFTPILIPQENRKTRAHPSSPINNTNWDLFQDPNMLINLLTPLICRSSRNAWSEITNLRIDLDKLFQTNLQV